MILSNKIALGSVQFGIEYGISNLFGQTTSAEVSKILQLSQKLGVTTIDTASTYGTSEQVLGINNIAEFEIVSKFMPPDTYGSVEQQLRGSLSLLKIEKLYGYLAHRPLDLLDNLLQWEELQNLKESNLIGKIGFSVNEPDDIKRFLDKGLMPDIIQAPFNYFDRRFENELINLKDLGCEIFTRSAFLQGLFFMDVSKLGTFFDEVKPAIRELQKKSNYLASDLLYYVLKQPFIDKVVIGVESALQLKNNILQLDNAVELATYKYEISKRILTPSLWPS